MGIFDDIIAIGTSPRAISMFQKIGDAATRAMYAPQTGTSNATYQFFQDRRTGNPGVVQPMEGVLGRQGGSPVKAIQYTLDTGPKTDLDTIDALRKLRADWQTRESRYPGEGMMYIDPQAVNNAAVFRHEATHSLYDQAVPTPTMPSFDTMADRLGLYDVAARPDLRGSEAAAYEVGWPTSYPSKGYDQSGPMFMQSVFNSAQTPSQRSAAQRLSNLYRSPYDAVMNTGALGK